jgi:predicted amidohydrolase
MEKIRIATAQFENRSNDKQYNLAVIKRLSAQAAAEGAHVICFHECSVTGYSFARNLTTAQLLEISEPIPSGPSTKQLISIARDTGITILAGFFERDDEGNIFKAMVCVNGSGVIAKFRKLHPFIHPAIVPGHEYVIFEIGGWKCSILICYDNNIIENVRAVTLLGAEVIFMPHVTMCTPSPAPGRGYVDPRLWVNRENDPTSLRLEFDGPKGRTSLMKWLPSRAYDNGVYVVFSNPIGMDDDQLKNGCSMIIDPFGDIIAECRSFDDSFALAVCTKEKIGKSGGHRYMSARRPELYKDIIGAPHEPVQKVAWMQKAES